MHQPNGRLTNIVRMLLSKRYTIDAKKPLQVGQPVRLLNRADSSGGTASGVVVAVKRGRVESLPMRADIAEAPVTAQAEDSATPIPGNNHAQSYSGLTASARAAQATDCRRSATRWLPLTGQARAGCSQGAVPWDASPNLRGERTSAEHRQQRAAVAQ